MVYTEEQVRANIRVRDGKRVFFLGAGDLLTPSAKSFLRQARIEVRPAAEAKIEEYQTLFGATLTQKPEHMTHLRADVLVMKDHPRIRFRGMIDALEAELLLCLHAYPRQELEDVLAFVRSLIPADVLGEEVKPMTIGGMTADDIREQSHFPQKYYGIPHFMPSGADDGYLLHLNKIRTLVRQTELAAYDAFKDRDGNVQREDMILALNRLSSLFWILMIREKSK